MKLKIEHCSMNISLMSRDFNLLPISLAKRGLTNRKKFSF